MIRDKNQSVFVNPERQLVGMESIFKAVFVNWGDEKHELIRKAEKWICMRSGL